MRRSLLFMRLWGALGESPDKYGPILTYTDQEWAIGGHLNFVDAATMAQSNVCHSPIRIVPYLLNNTFVTFNISSIFGNLYSVRNLWY